MYNYITALNSNTTQCDQWYILYYNGWPNQCFALRVTQYQVYKKRSNALVFLLLRLKTFGNVSPVTHTYTYIHTGKYSSDFENSYLPEKRRRGNGVGFVKQPSAKMTCHERVFHGILGGRLAHVPICGYTPLRSFPSRAVYRFFNVTKLLRRLPLKIRTTQMTYDARSYTEHS